MKPQALNTELATQFPTVVSSRLLIHYIVLSNDREGLGFGVLGLNPEP